MGAFSIKIVAGNINYLFRDLSVLLKKCQLLHYVKLSYCRWRQCYVILNTVTKSVEIKRALTPIRLYNNQY
jgi:hypothetical protein